MHKKQLDPSIIAGAPDDVEPMRVYAAEDSQLYERLVGDLAFKLEAAEAEIEELSGQQTVDQVRAKLIGPYANKVYNFVAVYCLVVAVLLVLSGFQKRTNFELSDTILAIIAGSTAVAVIGLIGMVVTGLFGSSKT